MEDKFTAANGAVKLLGGSLAGVVGTLGVMGIESEAFGEFEKKAASAIAVAVGFRDVAEGLRDMRTALKGVTVAQLKANAPTATYGLADVLEASYRAGYDTSDQADSPLTKVDRSTYTAFSNKNSQGTPSQYWVQRFVDKVTMTLYLTPGGSQAGYFINFYYTKRIDDVGAYTNATDVPYRFVPCMIMGLSYYLALKYAPQRVQELKLLYEDELKRAESEDGSSNSTYISPKIYFPGVS